MCCGWLQCYWMFIIFDLEGVLDEGIGIAASRELLKLILECLSLVVKEDGDYSGCELIFTILSFNCEDDGNLHRGCLTFLD